MKLCFYFGIGLEIVGGILAIEYRSHRCLLGEESIKEALMSDPPVDLERAFASLRISFLYVDGRRLIFVINFNLIRNLYYLTS